MQRKTKKKLIVFDMDGVIVDVSRSYRETVRQTCLRFLEPARDSGVLPDPLFSLGDLAAVKQTGGLNNDWDLTYFVLNLLFSRVDSPSTMDADDPWQQYHETVRHCDVALLAEYLSTHDNALQALTAGQAPAANPVVDAFSAGDVGSGNLIKQLFQEIYLGQDLFESIYGMPPLIYQGKGLIHGETLILHADIFETLAASHILAVATGRPRAEAEFALDNFDIRQYFTSIITLDDCLRAEQRIFEKQGRQVSLSKPHPFMLESIAAGNAKDTTERFYIGDMPDDMQAAARARPAFRGVGFVFSAQEKESAKKALRDAGAAELVYTDDELLAVLGDPREENT